MRVRQRDEVTVVDLSASSVLERVSHLAQDCVRSAHVDGGAVALVSDQGARLMMSATDHLAAVLERSQVDLGEGPFVDAERSGEPVLVADLGDDSDPAPLRWPFFARAARDLDVAAFFAFPIRVSTVPLGTLGLYRCRPGLLTAPQIGTVAGTADGIARELLGTHVSDHASTDADEIDQLSLAPTIQLHQAAGMVMMQLDVSIPEAIARLRATAFAENIALADLARDIVQRHRRLGRGDLT